MRLPKEFFDFLKQKVENIGFAYIIEMTTGYKVLPISASDTDMVNEIYNSSKDVLNWAKRQDFSKLRPNEISNELEKKLREQLGGQIPEGKTAGYPDILVTRANRDYYVEVKLAGIEQMNSGFRTFYYEPVELTKVTRNACHIMVGYMHEGRRLLGFKIIDLSKISVSLKNEFNASNKELYKDEAVVKEYSVSQT